MRLYSTVMFFVLFITGCASVNEFLYKGTCTGGQWESVGEKDGERGVKDLTNWTSRCQAFGTQPDAIKYDKGYAMGLKKYCQSLGYNQGKKGEVKDLIASCTDTALKKVFEDGYSIGQHELCTPDTGTQHALNGQLQQEVCKNIPPYTQSYEIARKDFCSTARAFKMALEQKEFKADICDVKQRSLLTAAYNRGKTLVESRQKAVALEAEIDDLTKKIYDASTPADAKKHYESILATKKSDLKNTERAIYSLELEEKKL